MCWMHYMREYRHGDVDLTATGEHLAAPRRYRSRYLPMHPLAMANGKVYVHRLVLFESIGPGIHPCHWCQRPVDWLATKGDPAMLVVDHLNGATDDNEPSNLVASCHGCNTCRGAQRKSDELRASRGLWSNRDTIALGNTQTRRSRIASDF
jgi:hypothetical protein